MPDHRVHKKISKLLLEKDCELTHSVIDYPVRFLGENHRILFHDPLSASVIGFISDGYVGVFAGLLHLATDKYFPKSQIVRRLIDYLL